MIKEEFITINGHSSNYLYYQSIGYNVEVRKPFIIKSTDLMKGSVVKITTICSICQGESRNVFKDYYNYTNGLTEDFFCKKCKIIKSEKTCIEKYGVRNPMQTLEVKEILKNSIRSKYGVDHYSQTDEYKVKFKETCFEKYGVENPFSSESLKEKIKNTNIEKYGVDYISKLDHFKESFKEKKERNTYKKYVEVLSKDYKVLSYSNEVFQIYHDICGLTSSINKGLVISRNKSNSCICTECNPIGVQYSSVELELRNFLDEYNIKYIKGSREILNGLELDVYIPEYNIAIEMNGVYWHSELYKDSKYHINKTLKCRELNIELIHIWEDDWKNKNIIIKSIILNKLGLVNKKIFARKCLIKLVSSKDARFFLDENHIQGFSASSIKIGLYYKDELVSLMTFGYRFTNGKKEYELIRFCNLINYIVVGSASKIFSFFTKNYNIQSIISYSDISIFSGKLYNKLGFNKVSISKPNYFWVVDGTRKHRFNYNKKKLVAKGFDINKTELEIMHDQGYYRVFSCGQEKWIYTKPYLKI